MPRKLPWLKDVPEKPAPKLAERPGKRPRVLSPDLRDDLDSPGAGTPRRKGKTRANDIWIMVEDEFLDTARLFTQHLHHAEYHRLKRLAREKNTSALQSISRPVVARGKMSVESQKKHEAMARAQRQAEVMRQIEGGTKDADELEEEAPWAHDPHLGGLMSGSQDSSSQLATLAGIKSKTRAAAGYVGAGLKSSPAFPESSTGRGSNSSFAGLAKEIERTAASSDEDDLDNSPSCRRPVKKGLGVYHSQLLHTIYISYVESVSGANNYCKHNDFIEVKKAKVDIKI
ncbi:hypothetical protein SLS56_001980 [Neofusicoccum ribis]|uniref:Uncharacterized protein n=1 Tax=Neofusicoccum ribis TaxID=45134 RepID=A0ABR3T6M8_9PEZI